MKCPEEIYDKLSEHGYFISDLVFNSEEIQNLYQQAQKLRAQGAFRAAEIGRSHSSQHLEQVRGDEIFWLEEWSSPELKKVESLFQELMVKTREELFLSLKRFESHLSFYPKGAHYDKHVDRHRERSGRLLSSVLYLGPWQAGDGGELYLYPPESEAVKVEPVPGRWIIFRSELEHEVVETRSERWSLTTWLRDDEPEMI